MMATREQALGFIKEIAPIVQEVCKSRDKWILPSVAIAQAACESDGYCRAFCKAGHSVPGSTLYRRTYGKSM